METSSAFNSQHKTKGKIGRIITIALLVLFLCLGIFVWWSYYFTYSEGNRYGLLQKFSKRGSMFKTYEGEIILRSIKANSNVAIASEKFLFSVTDDAVAQQLNNLQGHTITLHYKEKNRAAFWRGDSKYVVDSVKAEP